MSSKSKAFSFQTLKRSLNLRTILLPFYFYRSTKKATLVGAKSAFGLEAPAKNTEGWVHFYTNVAQKQHNIIFKYRTRQALVLAGILQDTIVAEKEIEDVKPFASSSNSKEKPESSKAAGKRKADTAVVVIDDGEEDVKPFKKKNRSGAASSKDKAIDLTDL